MEGCYMALMMKPFDTISLQNYPRQGYAPKRPSHAAARSVWRSQYPFGVINANSNNYTEGRRVWFPGHIQCGELIREDYGLDKNR